VLLTLLLTLLCLLRAACGHVQQLLAGWREDNRRTPNKEQVERVTGLALKRKPSVDFCGYWQRHKSAA
jgi:hypothetical protein